MTNPIELIVAENKTVFDGFDSERAETVKGYLDMILSYSYGRATHQHKSQDQFAMIRDAPDGLGTAQIILHRSGYVVPGPDAIYVATDKGIGFMEKHYSGQELWGVKIN